MIDREQQKFRTFVFDDDPAICGGAGGLFSISFVDLNPDRAITNIATTEWNFEVAEIKFVSADDDYVRIFDALFN